MWIVDRWRWYFWVPHNYLISVADLIKQNIMCMWKEINQMLLWLRMLPLITDFSDPGNAFKGKWTIICREVRLFSVAPAMLLIETAAKLCWVKHAFMKDGHSTSSHLSLHRDLAHFSKQLHPLVNPPLSVMVQLMFSHVIAVWEAESDPMKSEDLNTHVR